MVRKRELSFEAQQSILFLRNEDNSMREIAKKLKISFNSTTPFREQHKWALTTIEREVGGSAQQSKRTSTLESLV